MIYTITFNPSLDYVMNVDHFHMGSTNRSSHEDIYVGGKGFNVSTILHRLDLPTCALGFVAGFSGNEIESLLNKRGFEKHLFYLKEGFSRINVKMKGEVETEINGSGPIITKVELDAFMEYLNQLKDGDTLVLAGSIPSSLKDDIYERIMERCIDKEIDVIVDATKDLLKRVLKYKPFLIKPNQSELEELFQTKINTVDDLIYYGEILREEGARNVLISRAAKGAILLSEDHHVYSCGASKGIPINSVGAGDSMVAGFIAGFQKNHDYKEALKYGSAAGGATAFSSDLGEKEEILSIYEKIEVEEII